MVASGGAWHSQEDGEEAPVTNPKFRPNRRETGLGMRSCHSEEDCEEASATSLEDWAKMPPARLGDLHFEIHHCSGHHARRQFGLILEAGCRGLLTVLLSVTRPHA